MTELFRMNACEQAELIRSGQISAVELLDDVLTHTEKADEQIHAFVNICGDEAREKARSVDRKLAAGEPVGALAGVPYSVKDVFCTRGIASTAGSGILNGWIPPYSAAAVERMDAADAILFGKTNCDEFAMGGTNETSFYQPCPCNPFDPERVAGGSSGGSAAAVAGFEGAVSLGSDTGGSIREPAAFCGVVGLKPTYGMISRWGLMGFASSMDTVGPITRTVKDAALMMNVLAGFDRRDNTTVHVPVQDHLQSLEKGVKGMRVGISPDLLHVTAVDERGEFASVSVDPDVSSALERTAALLASAGAEIVTDVPMPNTKYSVPAYYVISRIEAFSNLQRYDGLKYGKKPQRTVTDMDDLFTAARSEGFGREVRLRILAGLFLSRKEFYEKYYLRAQRVRALIRSDYERVFDPSGKYYLDVLLTPSVPMPAFRFDKKGSDPVLIRYADQFTSPMNFAGTPGISIPAGFSKEGLPIGVQLTAYDYSEAKLLRAAFAAEQMLKAEEGSRI